MLRKAGSFTFGEIEQVRDVGPSTPATKRGFSGVEYFSQAAFAKRAASRLISGTRSSM
ncbi:Uncharacterised protein [Acinetobacter baumannii]|nr:Uncharacterised protein [Acinetobacter baumannii]